MTDTIPCPTCTGIGECQRHVGWGSYVPYTCPCCSGKKVTTVEDACLFISNLMQEVEDEKYDSAKAAKELADEKKVTEQLRRDLGDSKILVEHFRARAGKPA